MAKTQLNVRMEEDAAEAARLAARARNMSVQDYIETLVRNDTDPQRAAFVDAARNVIAEYGDLIEERARAPRG
jgi:hypothetical protein